jgi:hypothetical protein
MEHDIMTALSIKQSEAIVGGLSNTSKMPTMSISLPATKCKTGAKLRKIAGSVCSTCYALKGCYVFPVVKDALATRLQGIDSLQWEDAMVTLITKKKRIAQSGLFRWHDSGDLQSMEHLLKIVRIAKRTPSVKHWIPTKEKALIREYARKHGAFPDNMIVRLSGAMIDGPAPNAEHTSTVTTDHQHATCHAYRTDKTGKVWAHAELHALTSEEKKTLDFGHCGNCRKCWSHDVKNVVYLAH